MCREPRWIKGFARHKTLLTKGLDNVAGTSGNDTIIGSIAGAGSELLTVSALDIVNGGAGVDTLKISDETGTIVLPNMTAVEVVEVSGAAGVTVDTTATTGVTDLNIVKAAGAINADAGATTNVSVVMKDSTAGTDAHAVDGGNNVTFKLTDAGSPTTTNTPDTISIGAGGSVGGAAAGAGATAATGDVVVESTGKAYTTATAATTLGAIRVDGGKTISVTQKAAADKAAAAADTSNVVITQGAITVNANADTTAITVKQDAAAAAINATNKTGGVTETATVKFSAMTAGQTVILGGLTFTAAKDLTKEDAAKAFANLAAGIVPAAGPSLTAGDTQGSGVVANGVYTGALTGYTSGAANGDTVTFTSTTANAAIGTLANTGTATAVVTISAGKAHDAGATGGAMGVLAGTVTVNAGTTVKTVTIDSYGATSAITGGAALETLNLSNSGFSGFTGALANAGSASAITVANSAATLALNLEKVGVASTAVVGGGDGDAGITISGGAATLNVKSTGNNYVDLSAATTKTLNVSGTGVLKADTVALNVLEAVKVTETAGLTLDATPAATLTSVDTTGTTGAVTVTIDGTKATYAGGAGKDTVNLSNTTAVSKVIDLGAGDDTLVLGAGTTAVPTETLKGSDGTDTLSMTTASAVSFGGATTFAGKISGFERLTINNAAGTADGTTDTVAVNVENLGFNYVTTTGTNTGAGGARDILQLNNLANNSTVVLTADGHVQANIKNATDVANTSDVLNVVARVDGDVTHGTLTATGVETVNLTTEDTTPVNTATGAATINKSTLTLAADKATSINLGTSNAHLDLSLTAATNKVTLIDGTNMTGNLNVQAVGATSTTVKGGSGNDVLKASVGVVSTVNSTGTNATINTAATGTNAVTEVQTLTITPDTDGADTNDEQITVVFGTNGSGGTGSVVVNLAAVDPSDAVAVASAVRDALNSNGAFSTVAVASVGSNVGVNDHIVTITYNTAGVNYTEVTATGGGTQSGLGGTAGTSFDGAAAIAHQVTVGLASTTVGNNGLSAGDTMSVNVGGTVFTYTATGAVDLDTVGNELATLINADAKYTAVNSIGTDTITITAATAGTAGQFTVSAFAVTDAFDVAAAADKLFGGAGNDVLVANALMTEMTGGAGNDLFVINTASINVNSYSTILDFQAGDLIKIDEISAFKSAKVDLGGTAVFQDLANAAVSTLALNEAGWFQFGGDTYIVADKGTNGTTTFVNGEDFIVKLAGLVDLSNASFNNTHDTIALA